MPTGCLELRCWGCFQLLDARDDLFQLIQRVVKTLGEQCFFIRKVIVESAFRDLQLFSNFVEGGPAEAFLVKATGAGFKKRLLLEAILCLAVKGFILSREWRLPRRRPPAARAMPGARG